MKKKFLCVFVSLLVVVMFNLSISTVFAKNNTKFLDVNGQLIIWGGGQLVFTPAGKSGNTRLDVTGNAVEWTGDLEGIGFADGNFLLHNFGTPDAWSTALNIHTLEAEVDGQTGTLTIITTGSDTGTWRILKGTGELANLHGQGTWKTVIPPALYNYEGQVHFDPQP